MTHDDYLAARDREFAEAEAAEAAYNHAMDEPICTCAVCGLITPLCDCELSTEAKINAALPWPSDLSSLTVVEAAELAAKRGRMRERMAGRAV